MSRAEFEYPIRLTCHNRRREDEDGRQQRRYIGHLLSLGDAALRLRRGKGRSANPLDARLL